MKTNILLDVDSYKVSMPAQYPKGTEKVFSYVESRGGKYSQTVFFGLQYILKEHFSTPITKEMVEEADAFYKLHGEPFNKDNWMYIVEKHGGKLPLKIRAIAEGAVVPTHNVLMTVENTDPKCYWLTTWVETALLRVWYPITVASQSWTCKQIIKQFLNETSENPDAEIAFKLHDFGSRGVSTQESAAIGGAAHLVNFMGSDTVAGVYLANKYYNSEMAGFSIPAAEHSTITSWGEKAEIDAYRNMLTQFAKPGSLVACVSDSYDLYNAVENIWGKELKQEVIDSGATVIIRPDSGNPVEVSLKTLQLLDKTFGSTYNAKGFKVLNNTRVIYGDGINEDTIRGILQNAKNNGFSATNLAFGMGGALLQQVNRDTQKFAYKCSSVVINGKRQDVQKKPKTDPSKASKAGELSLIYEQGQFKTVVDTRGLPNLLQVVYENGELKKEYTLDQVRKRSNEF